MDIKPKTVRIIGLPSIYLIAFYCFSGSSVFEYIRRISGDGLIACLFVNAAAALIILSAPLINQKTVRMVYTVSFLLLLPSVLSHSKLDLIAIVFGIRFKESHPPLITALCVVLVAAGAILISRLSIFHNESVKWRQNGAEQGDVEDVYKRRVETLIFTMSAVLIPLMIIIISGFSIVYFIRIPLEPLVLVVAGAALAAAGIFFLVRSTLFGRKNYK